jgi:hypothetical protein
MFEAASNALSEPKVICHFQHGRNESKAPKVEAKPKTECGRNGPEVERLQVCARPYSLSGASIGQNAVLDLNDYSLSIIKCGVWVFH